jgi:hypothetical protein
MNFSRVSWTIVVAAVAVIGLAVASQGSPCTGSKRLQLRWSAQSRSAVVSLSVMRCGQPPTCGRAAAEPTPGTTFTTPPLTVTLSDAAGHTVRGTVNAAEAGCGDRCGYVNRGGCPGGTDTHRVAGSFVRYVFGTQGQATVVASKLKIAASEQPNLTAPLTVTITDAAGYSVEAQLKSCRTRQSTSGVAVACS